MESSVTDETQDAGTALRQALVDKLVREGSIRSPRVEAAFRAVPRHLFVPDIPLETVYSDTHITTKMVDGQGLSSSSQPTMMAVMLDRLQLSPGQRVLEIGAGTGYNAALLAHIVGVQGQVATIDIDEDIVVAARAHLAADGDGHVEVRCADGALGLADLAPYDRVIVTAKANDLPGAWREQLTPTGRLVVPMSIASMEPAASEGTAILATFDRVETHLESRTLSYCAFIQLRGAFGVSPKQPVSVGPATAPISLLVADPVDADRLAAALTGAYQDSSIGMAITAREAFGVKLWLWLRDPCFCNLWAAEDQRAEHIVPPFTIYPGKWVATSGLCQGSTLSLLAFEPGQVPTADELVDPDRARSLIVRTFGPAGALGRRLAAHLHAWEHAGRPFAFNGHGLVEGPRLRVYPREPEYLPSANEAVVVQRAAQLVFNWGISRSL